MSCCYAGTGVATNGREYRERSKQEGPTMRFDAIVIGSGQGGNPLVYALADHGWTVALIEKAYLGGTCVNTGCTPTKTMVASAQIAQYARSASRWGVEVENVRVNLPAVLARKNAVVQNFRAGHERSVAKRPNVHLYRPCPFSRPAEASDSRRRHRGRANIY